MTFSNDEWKLPEGYRKNTNCSSIALDGKTDLNPRSFQFFLCISLSVSFTFPEQFRGVAKIFRELLKHARRQINHLIRKRGAVLFVLGRPVFIAKLP